MILLLALPYVTVYNAYLNKLTYTIELTQFFSLFFLLQGKITATSISYTMHHNVLQLPIQPPWVYQVDYSGNAFTLQPSIERVPTYPTGCCPFMGCHPVGTSEDLLSL